MEPKGLLAAAMLIGLLLIAPSVGLAAVDTDQERPQRRERPQGPPPEFFQACTDKQAGEAVSIETPHGHVIDAICTERDGRLVAKPLNDPPPPPDKEQE